MKIGFDKEKCCACGACSVACMALHDTDLAAGEQPFRRVRTEESVRDGALRISYFSEACRHCEKALCMEACPSGAMGRDDAAGFVFVDKGRCVGCGACIEACPFGVISRDKKGRASKCDGCHLLVFMGGQPVCVTACPYGALRLEE